jgi:cytochrome c oxidase assembly protein subunit 15
MNKFVLASLFFSTVSHCSWRLYVPNREGDWFRNLDIAGAFSAPAAQHYEFGVQDYEEQATMHVMHNAVAACLLLVMVRVTYKMYRKY